jgi:exonuclease SbcC
MAARRGVGREQVTAADERLKQIAPQLRELRQWRRWSTDEHREQLCAQIEALAADTQHADEPSINRLRRAQRSNGKCSTTRAHPPPTRCGSVFDRLRSNPRALSALPRGTGGTLRSENRKQREALAKTARDFLAKVDWERVDWKKLHRAEREMRQAWSRLVEAPGGDKHGARDRAIEGRFRRALRRLDHTLAEERERNQAEKQQLLEQMRALADEPDLRSAMDTAKQLQQPWHTTVPARHRDENALWQQFRSRQ